MKKAAKAQADREAAEKAARDQAERDRIEKARLDAKELERQKAAVRSSQPKKARPNTAIIVAVIGLVGTLGAALISSPLLQGMFSRTPEPTATLFLATTSTETSLPTNIPAPSKTPTKFFTPTATLYPTKTLVPSPTSTSTPESSAYTASPPIINGKIQGDEWKNAVLISTFAHGNLYYMNDDTNLYLLFDVTEDTIDDLYNVLSYSNVTNDKIHLSFDVNENHITDLSDVYYGYVAYSIGYKFGISTYISVPPASCSSTGATKYTSSTLGLGFGSSPSQSALHRIWELALNFTEIQANHGEKIRFSYGLSSDQPKFSDSVPPGNKSSSCDFTNMVELILGK